MCTRSGLELALELALARRHAQRFNVVSCDFGRTTHPLYRPGWAFRAYWDLEENPDHVHVSARKLRFDWRRPLVFGPRSARGEPTRRRAGRDRFKADGSL